MGKVIASFQNGYRGTVSRQKDDVIKSFKNAGGVDIPFGVPVFLKVNDDGVEMFGEDSVDTRFVGFSVRIADKTPDTLPTSQFADPPEAKYTPNDPVDVLVRGSMIVPIEGTAKVGAPVYLNADGGALITTPGAQDVAIRLTNVTVSRPKDASGMAEIVITKRNLV